jgi:methylenetetrahydrofolate dehydrogenase (NADP+) / methenyltetrahydrofolate cyclohydrolase
VTAEILDGRTISAQVLEGVKQRAEGLQESGIHPTLCFVTIGESEPALMYVLRLEKLAARVGIQVRRRVLQWGVSLGDLDDVVAGLNEDERVDGILVQMPLPDHLTAVDLSVIIDARKDVDGLTVHNAGKLYLGMSGQVPSTALAMAHILHVSGIDPVGMHAVVVGRSNVVGHPVAELLLQCDATVTVAHRATRDLGDVTRQADILMVGAGEPCLIQPNMVKPGAVIVDAGINPTDFGVVGDVDFEGCRAIARAITPVPGGVGPVTNAMVLRNLVDSAEQRLG